MRPAVGDRTRQAKLLVPMCKKSSIQKAFSKRDARLLKLADEVKIADLVCKTNCFSGWKRCAYCVPTNSAKLCVCSTDCCDANAVLSTTSGLFPGAVSGWRAQRE